MALVLADRVKETTTTTGTGTVTLAGAATGFQSFAVVGNGNTTYYTIAGQGTAEWEVGIGTYTSAGTTLARTTVLASSNAGSLVVFSAGTKDVFVTYPAGRSIYADGTTLTATNSSVLPATSGGTGQSSYAVGDLVYASTTTALSKLADVATGNALISGGVSTAPSYGKIGLTTHVSGTLPTANGGTNLTSFTANGVVYASSTSALATGSALQFTADGLGIGAAANTSPGGAYYNLNIGTGGGGGIISAGTDIYFTSNCYITGGNNYFAYSGSAYASYYNQTGGKHQWKTSSAAGTGGNVATLNTLMTLDASGNLGLGVTPSAWGSAYKMFQASTQASFGGNSSNITIVGSNYYNDGASKYIGTGLAALYLQDSGLHKWYNAPSGTAGNAITFTQAMTLDASGNVGIGTTSPIRRLSLNEAASTQVWTGYGQAGTEKLVVGLDASGNGNFLVTANAPAIFSTNNTERMRIDTSGNVGIAVTPNTWSSGKVLEIGNSGNALWGNSPANVYITENAYYNAGWKYGVTAGAATYQLNQNSHAWSIAPSGTAGAAITFTTAMTLDASSNLSVTGNIAAGNGMIVNTNTVSANYSIPSGSNALSAGPVSVNTGIVVTIPTGSVWTVV